MSVLPDRGAPAAVSLAASLAAWQRRFRLEVVCDAIAGGAAGVALALGVATLVAPAARSWPLAVAIGAAVATIVVWRGAAPLRPRTVALELQRRVAGLDNLIVTAEELLAAPSRVHPIVREEVFVQAAQRADAIDPRQVSRIRPRAVRAAAFAVAAGIVMTAGIPGAPGTSITARGDAVVDPAARLRPGDLRVTVTAPVYTGRTPQSFLNPGELRVIAGSRVRLELAGSGSRSVRLIEPGAEPALFERSGAYPAIDRVVQHSRVWLISEGERDQASERLLSVQAIPDRPPVVRLRAPGKDLVFGTPDGRVDVEIDAEDDLAIAELSLKYTRVAGSGESFTFEEGLLPVQVQRREAGRWNARGRLDLKSLALEDGDTIVYRALVRDSRPGADPVASESYLIEIGRLGEAASSGFAVPEERDRQGLSQQMLIIKTERLHAQRQQLTPDGLLEQSRLLAMEQRMVRAEFVFMTGGEVQDEVEEAEHAHELVEGRFENEAQIELFAAIREMSRAEARLNAADTSQALTFERSALRALQRAFDRRRYLLRTLSERTRIDPARRMTGDLSAAASSRRSPARGTNDDERVNALRGLLVDLAQAIESRQGLDATLGARVASIDVAAPPLQRAAAILGGNGLIEDRLDAARAAQTLLMDRLRQQLAPAATGAMSDQPAIGEFYGRLRRGGRQ